MKKIIFDENISVFRNEKNFRNFFDVRHNEYEFCSNPNDRNSFCSNSDDINYENSGFVGDFDDISLLFSIMFVIIINQTR